MEQTRTIVRDVEELGDTVVEAEVVELGASVVVAKSAVARFADVVATVVEEEVDELGGIEVPVVDVLGKGSGEHMLLLEPTGVCSMGPERLGSLLRWTST